jgi:hypothetical protein
VNSLYARVGRLIGTTVNFEKFEFEIEWISTEGHEISELLYLASGWAKIFEAINMLQGCHLWKKLPPRSKDGSREGQFYR